MSTVESRRKWLSRRTVWNCLLASGGILILAALFRIAEGVVTSNLPFIERILLIIFMWLLLAGALLLYGLLSPELMRVVFKMLGFEEKEEAKEKSKPKP